MYSAATLLSSAFFQPLPFSSSPTVDRTRELNDRINPTAAAASPPPRLRRLTRQKSSRENAHRNATMCINGNSMCIRYRYGLMDAALIAEQMYECATRTLIDFLID